MYVNERLAGTDLPWAAYVPLISTQDDYLQFFYCVFTWLCWIFVVALRVFDLHCSNQNLYFSTQTLSVACGI